MRRIKIMYIITGIHVGGAERLLLDTARNLNKEKFLPIVVSLVGGNLLPAFRKAGLRAMDVRMSKSWPIGGAWRLYRLIKKEKPAIIHTHLLHADFFGRLLGKLARVPVIISTLHMVEDARRSWIHGGLDRLLSRWNTAFIAVSSSVKTELVALEKLDPATVTVIRNATTDTPPLPPENLRKFRNTLGLPPDALLIGIVSRLEIPRKGHHILFAALQQIVQRHPRIHCLVIGDGAGRENLQNQIRQLELQNHVTFAGTQHNIPQWLQILDIFVLPSLLEGFPMAIVEAMAAARPIIATRVGGNSELIIDGHNGRLIEPGNPQDLAAALNQLIEQPSLRQTFGQRARERFLKEFEIHGAIQATERLYEQCLHQQGFSRKIRLLEVLTNFDPGGVPRHVTDLIANLPESTFDIGIVSGETLPDRIPSTQLGHHQVNLVKPVAPWKDLTAIGQMLVLFRRLRPDIVHNHMSKSNCLGSIAARLAGVPLIINTAHGQTRFTLGPSLKQFLFDLLDIVTSRFFGDVSISVSQTTTRYMIATGRIPAARNVTILNGIAPWDPTDVSRASLRGKFGLDDHQPVILMTGRLADPKEPQILIEACRQLKKDFPNLICWIAGDGPRQNEMENLINRAELQNTVHLLGHRNDISNLLKAADIFVLCSRCEGLPISVLEAMAAGMPVVASRISSLEELVIPGTTGELFHGHSPDACAAALKPLLAQPEKRVILGQNGYQRFLEKFTLSRQMAETRNFFMACIEGRFPNPDVTHSPVFVQEEANV